MLRGPSVSRVRESRLHGWKGECGNDDAGASPCRRQRKVATPRDCLRLWQGRSIDLREVLITLAVTAESSETLWDLLYEIFIGTRVAVLAISPQIACVSFARGYGRLRPGPNDEVKACITNGRPQLCLPPEAMNAIRERGRKWCESHTTAPSSCSVRDLRSVTHLLWAIPDDALKEMEDIFRVAEEESSIHPRVTELWARVKAAEQAGRYDEADRLGDEANRLRLALERTTRRRSADLRLGRVMQL